MSGLVNDLKEASAAVRTATVDRSHVQAFQCDKLMVRILTSKQQHGLNSSEKRTFSTSCLQIFPSNGILSRTAHLIQHYLEHSNQYFDVEFMSLSSIYHI